MALLTPNATYQMNGVTIKEKIIPDGTVWKDAAKAKAAGFSANSLYKKQQKLSGGTGKAQSVTIHNTNDLENVNDDGEQYTRATYNENMNSARVHFYIDDTGAWQNLKAGTGLCANDPVGSAEVGWHSGDGSVADGGNMTSLSLEIIMNESPGHDAIAYDNGARIAAWLLWKHGLTIDKLVTHTFWVNKAAGKNFADVDEQCCNPISGKKWCPTYIFNSSNKATAMKNWKAFKDTVKKYLDAMSGTSSDVSESKDSMTKITGAAEATAEQMAAYIRAKNPNVAQSVLDMISLYLTEGEIENIRGDVAFAQSCLETGNFAFAGSAVTLDQNNFCGMGVTSNGVKGNSFDTPQLGIRAQIQHLKAYANTAKLKQECVDPRFDLVSRGCAPYVEYLGQKENPKGKGWAAGAGYGTKILTILEAIKGTTVSSDQAQDPESEQNPGQVQNPDPTQSPEQEKGSGDNEPAFSPYLITTTCDVLNIRSGPGTKYSVVGTINEKEGKKKQYTIVEEKDGWGKLKSGAGWISLSYTKKGGEVKAEVFSPYLITTTCDVLNIRSGSGTQYPVVGTISEKIEEKKKYTIVEEKDGWGRLKSGAGWISLSYTKKAS